MTEFDAARSELFLARAAVLVEGLTEKLVLPFVFAALGLRRRPGGDLDHRVRRQAEHPALRSDLRGDRRPVRRRPRQRPPGERQSRGSRAGAECANIDTAGEARGRARPRLRGGCRARGAQPQTRASVERVHFAPLRRDASAAHTCGRAHRCARAAMSRSSERLRARRRIGRWDRDDGCPEPERLPRSPCTGRVWPRRRPR